MPYIYDQKKVLVGLGEKYREATALTALKLGVGLHGIQKLDELLYLVGQHASDIREGYRVKLVLYLHEIVQQQ
jgi:hypothetical protein